MSARVALGRTYLLPPLSSGGPSLARPGVLPEFPHPAHRTGHADRPHPALRTGISRLHPRWAAAELGQAYEPEIPYRCESGWLPPLRRLTLCAGSQPPAQPHSRVVVERAGELLVSADTEVIGPPAKRAVSTCRRALWSLAGCALESVSAWTLSTMRLMLFFDGQRWPKRNFAGRWGLPFARTYIPSRTPLPGPCRSCLLLVHRQLQLAHDRADGAGLSQRCLPYKSRDRPHR